MLSSLSFVLFLRYVLRNDSLSLTLSLCSLFVPVSDLLTQLQSLCTQASLQSMFAQVYFILLAGGSK